MRSITERVQHVHGQRAEQGPGAGCVTWDMRVGFIAEVRVEGGWGASNVTVSGDNIPGRGVSKRGRDHALSVPETKKR